MSEQKPYPRPRQVTTAGILGAVGGTLLVLSLFDSVSRLRTVEMRDAVQEFLAEPPGDGLGVSVAWVLDALHVMMLVNGALAAVAAVLAVYLFWGHRAARIGFTVTAGILMFTSPFSGGALAVLLAIAAVMLWSRPAREWFAGRDPARPAPEEVFAARRGEQPDPSWAPPRSRAELPDRRRPPPAARPFGRQATPGWEPPRTRPQQASYPQPVVRRPGAVVAAALLTWGLSSLVLFVFSVVVALLMGAQDVLLDEVARDRAAAGLDLSDTDVLAMFWVLSAVIIFWCLAAVALGVLVLKRQGWARVTLTLSCVMTVLVSAAVGVAGMDLAVAVACMVYVLGAGLTIVLLHTRGSSAWFAGNRSGRGEAPRPSGRPPVW